jgi:hypothetical protein
MSVHTCSRCAQGSISSKLGLLTQAISEWRSGLSLSHELDDLDDWMRRDVGLPPSAVRAERCKPFWAN